MEPSSQKKNENFRGVLLFLVSNSIHSVLYITSLQDFFFQKTKNENAFELGIFKEKLDKIDAKKREMRIFTFSKNTTFFLTMHIFFDLIG